mmetsp:Transcript_9122/g.19724  ORF Transcript_9122/g.19724 Transcript_9122/m.19724 type:complete len:92 (+) Transcript_9122:685-960(+)
MRKKGKKLVTNRVMIQLRRNQRKRRLKFWDSYLSTHRSRRRSNFDISSYLQTIGDKERSFLSNQNVAGKGSTGNHKMRLAESSGVHLVFEY